MVSNELKNQREEYKSDSTMFGIKNRHEITQGDFLQECSLFFARLKGMVMNKEKIGLYLQFLVWLFYRKKTILNKQKQIVCPIMFSHFERFNKDVVLCDIPKTREQSLINGCWSCTQGLQGRTCVSRLVSPNSASEEANKRPVRKKEVSIHWSY